MGKYMEAMNDHSARINQSHALPTPSPPFNQPIEATSTSGPHALSDSFQHPPHMHLEGSLLEEMLGKGFSRQLEEAVAAATAGGVGQEPPEVFLDQLAGIDSFPMLNSDELADALGSGSLGLGGELDMGDFDVTLASSSLPPFPEFAAIRPDGSIQLDKLFGSAMSGGSKAVMTPMMPSAQPALGGTAGAAGRPAHGQELSGGAGAGAPPPAPQPLVGGAPNNLPVAGVTTGPPHAPIPSWGTAGTDLASCGAETGTGSGAGFSMAHAFAYTTSDEPSTNTTTTSSHAASLSGVSEQGPMLPFPTPTHYLMPPGAEGDALSFPQLTHDGFLSVEDWHDWHTVLTVTRHLQLQPPFAAAAPSTPLDLAPLGAALPGGVMGSSSFGLPVLTAATAASGIGMAPLSIDGGWGVPTTAAGSPASRSLAVAGRQRVETTEPGERSAGTGGEDGGGEEGLTIKQIKARQAQKRFREKQKARARAVEEGLEVTGVEIEREKAAQQGAQLTNAVLERMLEYKNHLVSTLRVAGQEEVPPAQTQPEMQGVAEEHCLKDVFPLEELQQHAVAGYTENMDSQGRVTEAPPVEKVVEEFAQIVPRLKQCVGEARAGGEAVVQRVREQGSQPSTASMVAGGGPPLLQQLYGQQTAAQQPRVVTWDQILQYARQRTQRTSSSVGSKRETRAGEVVELDHAMSERQSLTLTEEEEGGGVAGWLQSMSPFGASIVVRREVAARAASAAVAATSALREGSALEMDVREKSYLEAMLKRMLATATMRGGTPWTLVEGGLLTQEREGPYFFTGALLRRTTRLLRQVGVLLWQQALLFPDNILQLCAVRLDTGQPASQEEQQVHAQWDHLVEQLELKPSQMRDIMQMHAEFVNQVRPVRRQRREAFEHLKQIQVRMMMQGVASLADHAQTTLSVGDLNNLLKHTTQMELAAYVTFCAGIFRVMMFPVQKSRVVYLSWPYVPQMHLIALAVARRLGVEPPSPD